MPLIDVEDAGLENSSESYPWCSKEDIQDAAVAIIQAWGYLDGSKPDGKFQVCFLVQLLADAFTPDGGEIPERFCVSLDADDKENPRRRYLEHFANKAADPVGPVAMTKVDAKNASGFVWAWRKCPLPTEALGSIEYVQRVLYRQTWRQQAMSAHRQREQLRALEATARQAASSPNGQLVGAGDVQDDLPF